MKQRDELADDEFPEDLGDELESDFEPAAAPEPAGHEIHVPLSGLGPATARLDKFLAETLDLPRSRVQRWLEQGRVLVGGVPASKSSQPVLPGQHLQVMPPPGVDDRIDPEDGPLVVLYEDADLIAINKEAGLAVHPGAGRSTGTLVHRLLYHYPELAGVGGVGRPGIVHRLDQGTTGLMLVARTDFAYRALQQLFARRELEKTYLAVVHGEPKEKAGRIALAIDRHPTDRKKMAIREHGRVAITRWTLAAGRRHFSLLQLGLETGRTHQIRVHAKAIGHPLVGDPVYGEARRGAPAPQQKLLDAFGRPALHAWRLVLEHPKTQKRLEFEAPIPRDLLDLWQGLTGEPWPLGKALPPKSP